MESGQTTLNIALIHHPVINRRGEIIGSAVTNLDIHDIARMARTYGVARYYIVTPYQDQQHLVQELLEHWLIGHGATYNPARKEALEIVQMENSLDDVFEDMEGRYEKARLTVSTTAVDGKSCTTYSEMREKLAKRVPMLLLFGTAHGLAEEVFSRSEQILPPIDGGNNYNHLSVRSAASIIIDRLLGMRENVENGSYA